MGFQKQECSDDGRIVLFLSATAGVITEMVSRLLVMNDCEVKTNGEALELSFDIIYGEKKAVFYFRNLYLEIATVDRDAEPLQFDEKLSDYCYFLSKTSNVIKSKLEILLKMLKSEDTDKTIDEIYNEFKGERIYIEKINNDKK